MTSQSILKSLRLLGPVYLGLHDTQSCFVRNAAPRYTEVHFNEYCYMYDCTHKVCLRVTQLLEESSYSSTFR